MERMKRGERRGRAALCNAFTADMWIHQHCLLHDSYSLLSFEVTPNLLLQPVMFLLLTTLQWCSGALPSTVCH